MNGKVKILFFCTVFVAGRAFCTNTAQLRTPIDALRYYKLSGLKHFKKQSLHMILEEYKKNIVFRWSASTTNLPLIPEDYYASSLGFFCKKELQLEKITAIPFKFRLGSVQQCDRLEGKNTPITQ